MTKPYGQCSLIYLVLHLSWILLWCQKADRMTTHLIYYREHLEAFSVIFPCGKKYLPTMNTGGQCVIINIERSLTYYGHTSLAVTLASIFAVISWWLFNQEGTVSIDLKWVLLYTHSVPLCRLWDRNSTEVVKQLSFDMSVSSMEYIPDGEVLVITYGKTIAFYNALRYNTQNPGIALRHRSR